MGTGPRQRRRANTANNKQYRKARRSRNHARMAD
eukprot:CAMPEP_0176379648 /NCGR_PEP_ID=MMETSP0126-20121128/30512_1 /TAXON_ID=141414 ORGANISM="Strombidinopsis acuminatum, Strain SPMC142" /NCGR_SAMPLE_ID=MMETSP0126 /ASSEMBLY_ACC=CAM_ASM_000229 /LENGTH=33 /DNA_ID= /DNA_START= /DNA_END= /DNA_ORIENTATION=